MKKYELLNQLLNEKAEAMKTIEELCAEWNITLSNKETQVINNIMINKGKIVEVPVVKEVVKEVPVEIVREVQVVKEVQVTNEEETNRLYDEITRHIRRINELAAHNEQLEEDNMKLENEVCYLQGQILGYKNTIAKLEETIEELKSAVEANKLTRKQRTSTVYNEIFDQDPVVETKTTQEEAQNQHTWITVEIPNDLKDNAELLALINEGEQTINKAIKEVAKKAHIKGFNDKIAKMIKELRITNEYNISVNYETNNKNETVAAYGEITIEDKTYCYKYHRCFANPTVYGLMNKEQLDKAFSEIKRLCKIDSLASSEFVIREEDVVYDIANDIVYWKTDDNAYKGYTSKYSFVWNPAKYAVPTAALNHNALKDETFRAMRKLNPVTGKKAWSLDAEREGQRVMNYLRQVIEETPEEIVVPVTKEETTKTTKENVSVVTNDAVETKEEYVVDGVVFCDDDIDIF